MSGVLHQQAAPAKKTGTATVTAAAPDASYMQKFCHHHWWWHHRLSLGLFIVTGPHPFNCQLLFLNTAAAGDPPHAAEAHSPDDSGDSNSTVCNLILSRSPTAATPGPVGCWHLLLYAVQPMQAYQSLHQSCCQLQKGYPCNQVAAGSLIVSAVRQQQQPSGVDQSVGLLTEVLACAALWEHPGGPRHYLHASMHQLHRCASRFHK